jgi:hypothetical protein
MALEAPKETPAGLMFKVQQYWFALQVEMDGHLCCNMHAAATAFSILVPPVYRPTGPSGSRTIPISPRGGPAVRASAAA